MVHHPPARQGRGGVWLPRRLRDGASHSRGGRGAHAAAAAAGGVPAGAPRRPFTANGARPNQRAGARL